MAGYTSAEEAIRDFLITGRTNADSPPDRVLEGFDAQPESIHFGKARHTGHRSVYAVTFENQSGQGMRFVFAVRQDDTGAWHFGGGAGGSAEGSPRRGHPWVNLGGGGWPTDFYAGGCVLEHSGAVTRVRLQTANGVTIEDTVDDEDTVLFLTEAEAQAPFVVELLDHTGRLVYPTTNWPFA